MPSLKVNEPSAYRPAPWHHNTQADRVGVRSSAAWGVRVARGCGLAIRVCFASSWTRLRGGSEVLKSTLRANFESASWILKYRYLNFRSAPWILRSALGATGEPDHISELTKMTQNCSKRLPWQKIFSACGALKGASPLPEKSAEKMYNVIFCYLQSKLRSEHP